MQPAAVNKNISNANSKQEPIAIIGMAVNMPGAPNVGRLWEILANGSNTVEEVRFKFWILWFTWLT